MSDRFFSAVLFSIRIPEFMGNFQQRLPAPVQVMEGGEKIIHGLLVFLKLFLKYYQHCQVSFRTRKQTYIFIRIFKAGLSKRSTERGHVIAMFGVMFGLFLRFDVTTWKVIFSLAKKGKASE